MKCVFPFLTASSFPIHHLIPRTWSVSVEQSASEAGAWAWVHWCNGQGIDSLFTLSVRTDTSAPTSFAQNRFLMQNGAVNTPTLPPLRSSRSGSGVQQCHGNSGAVSSSVAPSRVRERLAGNGRPLSVSLAICLFVKPQSTSSVEQAIVLWWKKQHIRSDTLLEKALGNKSASQTSVGIPAIRLPWKYGKIYLFIVDSRCSVGKCFQAWDNSVISYHLANVFLCLFYVQFIHFSDRSPLSWPDGHGLLQDSSAPIHRAWRLTKWFGYNFSSLHKPTEHMGHFGPMY